MARYAPGITGVYRQVTVQSVATSAAPPAITKRIIFPVSRMNAVAYANDAFATKFAFAPAAADKRVTTGDVPEGSLPVIH